MIGTQGEDIGNSLRCSKARFEAMTLREKLHYLMPHGCRIDFPVSEGQNDKYASVLPHLKDIAEEVLKDLEELFTIRHQIRAGKGTPFPGLPQQVIKFVRALPHYPWLFNHLFFEHGLTSRRNGYRNVCSCMCNNMMGLKWADIFGIERMDKDWPPRKDLKQEVRDHQGMEFHLEFHRAPYEEHRFVWRFLFKIKQSQNVEICIANSGVGANRKRPLPLDVPGGNQDT